MHSSAFIVFAALFCAATADQRTWTGIINDEQWGTANNWYPAGVPGPNDDVVINDAETKDATVVLVQAATVNSLTVGGAAAHVRVRVLAGLVVATTLKVESHGVLEVNSGAAAVSCNNVSVAGELEFAAGSLLGGFAISGTANFGGQAAKAFNGATVTITSAQNVLAAGSIQFLGSSTVTAKTGVVASGANTQFIVMDQSTDNSFVAKGFEWRQ